MSDELIKAIAQGKNICPYIHLPFQAGDDKILAAMNRKYTAKHYLGLVKKIRQAIPDVGLSTDVIVGFPGETKKQFANSAKLMKIAKYDMAYMAQYSPRPGTSAFKLKDNVSIEEKKRRENILNDILGQTALKNNQKFLHKKIAVLVEEKSKKGEWLGKNKQSKTVIIKSAADKNLSGKFVWVKINEVKNFGLYGILA
jgi:tRNA-2-methylthio-N6-dimethylallyladenosine synthase